MSLPVKALYCFSYEENTIIFKQMEKAPTINLFDNSISRLNKQKKQFEKFVIN